MSEVFRALADPSRRRILQLLRDGPLSAGRIGEHLPIAKNTLSGHLAILKVAGLVAAERQGTQQIYHLNLSVLEEALMTFMDGMSAAGGRQSDQNTRSSARRAK